MLIWKLDSQGNKRAWYQGKLGLAEHLIILSWFLFSGGVACAWG